MSYAALLPPRERRLRQRIDVLTDERDRLRAELREITGRPWVRITQAGVIAELLAACEADGGRTPRARDDARLTQRAKNAFGSWANAVEAAGFERPYPRGGLPGARKAAA